MNTSRRRVLGCVVLVGLLAAGSAGCATNPVTGERKFMLLEPEQDAEIGRAAGPELAKEFGGPYADPVVQKYVEAVGARVAVQAKEVGYPYEYSFTVLDSDVVNAFALPGGPIYVTRGLLFAMEDESQLAAVLSHEATHVAARHSAHQLSRELGAGFILSVLGAIAGKGDSGGGTSYGYAKDVAKLVGALARLRYSRQQETEADLYGLDFLRRAGYQPMGMVDLMEVFQQREQETGGGGLEFFRTHPSPKNRIADIRSKIRAAYPGAMDDDRLRVGREAYRENVLSRRELTDRFSDGRP